MNSSMIGVYSKLTIVNTYNKPVKIGNAYKILNDKNLYEFELIDFVSKNSGYQGYAYKNKTTQEIIVVHEGSQSLSEPGEWGEKARDWVYTNIIQIGRGKIPEQFYDSILFLTKIVSNHPNASISQVGMSLGGTLAQLNGTLEIFKNIETYTYNAYGASSLVQNLTDFGFILSNNNSNINNFRYKNEILSTLKDHLGNLYEANIIHKYNIVGNNNYVPDALFFHSIEPYSKNLSYNLVQHSTYADTFKVKNYNINVSYDSNSNIFIFSAEDSNHYLTYHDVRKYIFDNMDMSGLETGIIGLIGGIEINEIIYNIKRGDTIWDMCIRYGITREELLNLNPWLKGRFSKDNSFVLIRPDEKIILPYRHETSDGYAQPASEAENLQNLMNLHNNAAVINPIKEERKNSHSHVLRAMNSLERNSEIRKAVEWHIANILEDFCLAKGFDMTDSDENPTKNECKNLEK